MDFEEKVQFLMSKLLLWGSARCGIQGPVDSPFALDMADNGNIFVLLGGGTALLPPASPVCASVAGGIDCHILHSMPCHFCRGGAADWMERCPPRAGRRICDSAGSQSEGKRTGAILLRKGWTRRLNMRRIIRIPYWCFPEEREGEDISEAEAMYDYLQYNGIPESQLLLEEQSVNTVQNIVFSKKVIDYQEKYIRRWRPGKPA